MILHFVIDGKLTDQLIDNFMAVTEKNHFLVFSKSTSYIRITRTGNFISTYNDKGDDINALIDKLGVKAIILHSLANNFARVLVKIKREIPICWGVWGYDVYNLPLIESQIYAPITKNFLHKNDFGNKLRQLLIKKDILRNAFFTIFFNKQDVIGNTFKAHSRINYFLTFIKEDFEVFSKYYPNKFQFLYCTFSSIDQYLAGNNLLTITPDAENILLGNSHSPSSNYLDVITVLGKNLPMLNKVYVVLSYGSNIRYRDKVISAGVQSLGDHFSPLMDFIDRTSYIKILQSCSTGIFFHYRQQGMGNIIAMLYMGSRVYLSTRSPAYKFFLRNGIIVNSFENEFNIFWTSKPDKSEVENNRKKLDDLFSRNRVLTDISNLINLLKID